MCWCIRYCPNLEVLQSAFSALRQFILFFQHVENTCLEVRAMYDGSVLTEVMTVGKYVGMNWTLKNFIYSHAGIEPMELRFFGKCVRMTYFPTISGEIVIRKSKQLRTEIILISGSWRNLTNFLMRWSWNSSKTIERKKRIFGRHFNVIFTFLQSLSPVSGSNLFDAYNY